MLKLVFDTPGDRIAYLRTKSGLSQTQLGEKIDFPFRMKIANYENNRAQPSNEFIEKASLFFNCPKSFIPEGIKSSDRHGLEALEIIRNTPGIDETLVDFIADQITTLIINNNQSQEKLSRITREFLELKKMISDLPND